MKIKAKLGVVSGAGAMVTNKLVPEDHRAKLGYEPMLSDVKSSISHAYAFIGMKGTREELGLRCANLWVLPVDSQGAEGEYNYQGAALDASDKGKDGSKVSHKERSDEDVELERRRIAFKEHFNLLVASLAACKVWEGVGESDKEGGEEDMLLFVGFPSVKDPNYAIAHPGKSACEMITTAHPEWFSQFETAAKAQSGKRDNEEYTKLKKDLERKMLNGLYRNYPKTRGSVEYVNIATPLTNKYYLGRADSYGLEHTMAHYGGGLNNMRPKTDIPNKNLKKVEVSEGGIGGISMENENLTVTNVPGLATFHDFRNWRRFVGDEDLPFVPTDKESLFAAGDVHPKSRWSFYYRSTLFGSGTHYIIVDDKGYNVNRADLGSPGYIFAHGGNTEHKLMKECIRNGRPTVMLMNTGSVTQAFCR